MTLLLVSVIVVAFVWAGVMVFALCGAQYALPPVEPERSVK